MLWGVVTGTNVDYVELIWEELVQAIKTFFSDAASLKFPSKKPKPQFVPKGGLDEVSGTRIPKDLLTDAICYAEYYQKYMEMVARKPRQPTVVTDEESVKKKTVPPADKSKKLAPAKKQSLYPGNILESRPPPDEDQAGSYPGQSHWALARPNPEPMHEEFIAT
nr:hypothetical protein [Tanacetum cinerariifolium]